MSKYEPLWVWLRENGGKGLTLTFGQVEEILGFPLDHSFLTCKKELPEYGYRAGKISQKGKTVAFEKIEDGGRA